MTDQRQIEVTLTADVSEFLAAMRQATEALSRWKNRPSPGVRAMRRVADRERFHANLWFQTPSTTCTPSSASNATST